MLPGLFQPFLQVPVFFRFADDAVDKGNQLCFTLLCRNPVTAEPFIQRKLQSFRKAQLALRIVEKIGVGNLNTGNPGVCFPVLYHLINSP